MSDEVTSIEPSFGEGELIANSNYREEDEEVMDIESRANRIFDVFIKRTEVVDQRKNIANNELLKGRAIQIATSGESDFWRFVCLPKCSLNLESLEWEVNVNNPRYNTLTKAIPFDIGLVKCMREIGINSSITLVINDLEAPLIRIMDDKSGINPFKTQSIDRRKKVIENLRQVRQATRDWVRRKTLNLEIEYPIVFFSDFIDYESFLDGVDEMSLNLGSDISGAIRAEIDFINRADPGKSPGAAERIARARVSQYAYEGMLLAEKFSKGIYLASEYPVIPVWKKLTFAADIPTLFYAKDGDIKNI